MVMGVFKRGWETHADEGFLTLDAGHQLVLLDLDDQVLGLVVPGHGEGDVELADGLVPLVGQGSLLLGLLLAGGSLLGGRRFCFFSKKQVVSISIHLKGRKGVPRG